MKIKVSMGRCIDGLNLFYNGIKNKHQYQMKIWKNFQGFTMRELNEYEQVVYTKVYHADKIELEDMYYSKAFARLRSEFNLKKN